MGSEPAVNQHRAAYKAGSSLRRGSAEEPGHRGKSRWGQREMSGRVQGLVERGGDACEDGTARRTPWAASLAGACPPRPADPASAHMQRASIP
jgi:hypothetical protein